MSLIEHLFTSTWFPLPKPFMKGFKADTSCLWQSASTRLTVVDQRRGLSSLFHLSQHLLASYFSLPQSPELYSSVVVVQLAILSCFDALARVIPADGSAASALSRALSGKISEDEESVPYFVNVSTWNGLTLNEVNKRLVITNPELCATRGMQQTNKETNLILSSCET